MMENKEWRECLLSDIASVQTGPFGSQLKNEQYIKGGTPVVTVEHIKDFKIKDFDYPSVKTEDKERLQKYLVKSGDILFTRVGSVDLSAYIQPHQEGWMFSSRMLRVRPYTEVDSRFLSYFFQQKSFREYILNISVGATMPSINTEILKGIQISYPPLAEQKAIAAILSSLDDKIDLLQEQNKTLEAMAETLFRQWFIEESKEDWEIGILGDVIDIFDNQRIPLSKLERDKKKEGILYPYYGAASIMDYINDYIFDGNYILFAEDGTVKTIEGYPVIQYATGKFWVNNHTHVIKPKAPYNDFFIMNYLRKKNIELYITGAVQPKINQANLKAIDFPKFPIELVNKFIGITEGFFNKILANQQQIQTLTQLRDTLLPKLMSGELRVEDLPPSSIAEPTTQQAPALELAELY